MSVITVQKDRMEIERLLRQAQPRALYVLGCNKCAKASGTGGTEQVVAMREALAAHGFPTMAADSAPLAIEDGACDPQAVQKAAQQLRPLGFDTLLVLACGAGLKCVHDALSDVTIVPGVNTLGPGVTDKLACLACGDCGFEDGRCKQVAWLQQASVRLQESYQP